MKYVIILADGMADYKIPQLDNKTPLQYANTPTFDFMASHGTMGLVKTVPDNMPPGSDTANLAVMGYNPLKYYTGRSPFEAASIGVNLETNDIAFRCNFVTLSDEPSYLNKTMLDHSSDEISTQEAEQLLNAIKVKYENNSLKFYRGVSYRHLLVWQNGHTDMTLTPPHDIIGKKIESYMPKGKDSEFIYDMMQSSFEILDQHPINIERKKRGLKPGNSIWIWGEGRKPALPNFYKKYGLHGSVISAVDLIKGLGICVGLESIDVDGVTGNWHTNYMGKAEAAIKELKNGKDFVYIHIEAPDECGHRNELDYKVKAIEEIDNKVANYIMQELDKTGEDYKMMVLPDHPTPIILQTHTSDPVPFVIYQKTKSLKCENKKYDEDTAKLENLYFEEGYKLMDYFIEKSND